MQALPPEQGSQAPHMMLRHSLGGGGQARWSDTGKPLRAAPKLKPPALPGDTYSKQIEVCVWSPSPHPLPARTPRDASVAGTPSSGERECRTAPALTIDAVFHSLSPFS